MARTQPETFHQLRHRDSHLRAVGGQYFAYEYHVTTPRPFVGVFYLERLADFLQHLCSSGISTLVLGIPAHPFIAISHVNCDHVERVRRARRVFPQSEKRRDLQNVL